MQRILEKLRSLVGPDAVFDGVRAATALGQCTTGVSRSVIAVVYPTEATQVVGVVKLAHANGLPLHPVSTGHNWGYGQGPVLDGCIVLNLSRLNRIVEPPDRVTGLVTLEPGVTQADLAAYLERERLPFLVPTTGAGPSASIVGNALERGHGITPIADHFAAVTGIEAVLANGSIYRSPHFAMGASRGGHAFKWGIGPYVDGLFSQGSFGVVTKMTLVLARAPDCVKAFMCGVPAESGLERTVAAVQRILQRLPGLVGGINVMNARRVLSMAAPFPADRVGPDGVIPDAVIARMRAKHRVAQWTVFGTLYGTRRTVRAAQGEVAAILSPVASRAKGSRLRFVAPDTVARLDRWVQRLPFVRDGFGRTLSTLNSSMAIIRGRPNQTALPLAYWKSGRPMDLATRLDPSRDGCGLIWYSPLVEMKPTSVRAHVEMVKEIVPRHGLEPLITLTSLSETCFLSTVPLLFDLASRSETAAAQKCLSALLDAGAEGGFFPYRVGGNAMDWLMGRGQEYWQLVSQLKQAMDPKGIIAPGRYTPAASSSKSSSSLS
jgi:FAD/FMN-containing dehydrogenase